MKHTFRFAYWKKTQGGVKTLPAEEQIKGFSSVVEAKAHLKREQFVLRVQSKKNALSSA